MPDLMRKWVRKMLPGTGARLLNKCWGALSAKKAVAWLKCQPFLALEARPEFHFQYTGIHSTTEGSSVCIREMSH